MYICILFNKFDCQIRSDFYFTYAIKCEYMKQTSLKLLYKHLQVEREGKIQEEIKKVESERGWFSFWRSKKNDEEEKEKDISNVYYLS